MIAEQDRICVPDRVMKDLVVVVGIRSVGSMPSTIDSVYLAALLAAHGDRVTVTPDGARVSGDGEDHTYFCERAWIAEYSVTVPEAVGALAFALGDYRVMAVG